jgi:hypothetical protein
MRYDVRAMAVREGRIGKGIKYEEERPRLPFFSTCVRYLSGALIEGHARLPRYSRRLAFRTHRTSGTGRGILFSRHSSDTCAVRHRWE